MDVLQPSAGVADALRPSSGVLRLPAAVLRPACRERRAANGYGSATVTAEIAVSVIRPASLAMTRVKWRIRACAAAISA